MRIRSVDVPKELIKAQEEGKLVIFAGAGVSRCSPSSLPGFDDLVQELTRRTGNILTREEGEPADRFLGRLEKAGPKVRKMVKEILDPPDTRPNRLHCALLSLFRFAETVRLVTTNFDRHFCTASTKLFGGKVPIYRAPALPVGDHFRGIVYLHGCVDQEPDELVITDSDFGRAYLTEGWATSFLKGLFAKYTVLFVGYSHSELTMEYLARGLPPDSPRFALVGQKPEKQVGGIFHYPSPQPEWLHRRVTPIPYPHAEEDASHEALREAINAWAQLSRMGLLGHEQQIRRMVAESRPPLDPENASYLEEVLSHPATARVFAKYADTPVWLHWVEEKEFFKPLFKRDSVGDDSVSAILADWFTDKFLLQHPEEALAVVQREGQVLNPLLWWSIARALAFRHPPDAATLAKWIAVLLSSCPPAGEQRYLLEDILRKVRYPEDREVALLLFRELTAPRVVLKPSFAIVSERPSGPVYFDVTARGDDYCLETAWKGFFKPNLGAMASELETIIVGHLREAHVLLRSVRAADDEWSCRQSRSAMGVLIYAARELLEWLVHHNGLRAQVVIDDWASSGVPILEELAIHGVRVNPCLSPEDKLDWLMAKEWLLAQGLKHEVFQLIRTMYPEVGEPQRLRVLEAAERYGAISPEGDHETRAYELYNLLYWLTQVAPGCELAARKFSELQDTYPQFVPGTHPELDGWLDSTVCPGSHVTAEQLLVRAPQELIELLLKRDTCKGPGWNELLGATWEAAASSFEWSYALALELVTRRLWTPDVWEAILGGWAQVGLDMGQWERLLGFVERNPEVLRFTRPLADLLLKAVANWDDSLRPLLPRFDAVAGRLWEAAGPATLGVGASQDWLLCAIRHAGGILTEFWVYALHRDLAGKGRDKAEVLDFYRKRLARIISGTSAAAAMGKVVLAKHLNFLFALDPEWTRTNVVTLLDWTLGRGPTEQAWHGYLYGRWSQPLLPDLLPLYEQACSKLAREPSEIWRRLHDHLATIAIYGTCDLLESGWLNGCLLGLGASGRVGWAEAVWRNLSHVPQEGVASLWDKWMARYWNNRIDGIPAPLDSEEMGAMVNWSLRLRAVFPLVVDMIVSSPMPRLGGDRFYLRFAQSGLAANHPKDTARLMIHLLSQAPCPFPYCSEVQHIYQQVKTAGLAANDRMQLREQLLRVGCRVEDG